MQIGTHLVLTEAVKTGGAVAGILLAYLFVDNFEFFSLVNLTFLIVGVIISGGLFRLLIPARCPKCTKVQAYQRGFMPVEYVCRDCGNKCVTQMYQFSGGG